MKNIHPTACVDPKAKIAPSVKIGPYCIVGEGVVLEANVKLIAHVVVTGNVFIDADTCVYPFAVIGQDPQFIGVLDDERKILIGKSCQIREHVTIHPGTRKGGNTTKIGDACLLMVATHIAHDCRVGNHVTMANNATLGGHCLVEDHVIIGGLSAVHQFVRIGQGAIVGGMSGIENDIIPYGSVIGNRAYLCGLNIIGLKRRGMSREEIHQLRNAYRLLFADEGSWSERVQDVEELFRENQYAMQIIEFIKQDSPRNICMPAKI